MPNYKGTHVKPGIAFPREKIDEIIYSFPNEHDRVLFMLQYLTASRISEALSVYPKDIQEVEYSGKAFIAVTMNVLKRRVGITRRALIPKDDKFVPYIIDYAARTNPIKRMFTISKNLAWLRLTRKYPFMRTHIFRHSRITELVTRYNFSPLELVQFVGWANAAPSVIYVHLATKDIAKRFTEL